VADVIVDQRLLGTFDGALDRLQLLRDLRTGAVLFDHSDDGFEMAIGTFQAAGNRGMRVVLHL
jgi:hypothetical protein